MAAKLQLQLQAPVEGRITQQLAEDATFRQSGVEVESESARSAGLIPPVNSAHVRAFANHTPLAPKGDHRSGPSAPPLAVGLRASTLVQACFAYDAVNREPQREEPVGGQVGCGFLRGWNPVRSCKFRSVRPAMQLKRAVGVPQISLEGNGGAPHSRARDWNPTTAGCPISVCVGSQVPNNSQTNVACLRS
jgi:hypothetical protein